MNINMNKEILKEKSIESKTLIFHIPKSLIEVKAIVERKINEVKRILHISSTTPFNELKMKNTAEVYKIAKSFISDLEKGKKSFGFVSAAKECDDLHMIGIASCVSYARDNSSVLLVVNDLESSEWSKYKKYFTAGKLGEWDTCEWGSLCLLDYGELLFSNKSTNFDLKFIYSEFDALFWAIPDDNKLCNLRETYLDVLKSLDSISIVIKPKVTTMTEVKKIQEHFHSLGIPLKGVLQQGANS